MRTSLKAIPASTPTRAREPFVRQRLLKGDQWYQREAEVLRLLECGAPDRATAERWLKAS